MEFIEDKEITAVDEKIVKCLQKDFALKHRIFPFAVSDGKLLVLLEYGKEDTETVKGILKYIYKRELIFKNCSRETLSSLINKYMDEPQELPTKYLNTNLSDKQNPVDAYIVNTIQEATKIGASDIHFEPQEAYGIIRFRVDGVLQWYYQYPISIFTSIIIKLKLLGGMDISNTKNPQDGRINWDFNDKKIDMRLSSMPTTKGEKLVVRILYKNDRNVFSKIEESFSKEFYEKLENKNSGIILVTGPTGSGKSTTLYSLISRYSKESCNIITLEDPVEYEISSITQINVNSKAGLTFASGLRAVLRQDPDIIMVGEIRDEETAQMATRASITGHLVLSTIHTVNAVTSISRLRDMGIPSYLVGDSLTTVISQRLIRKLCPFCKISYTASSEETFFFNLKDKNILAAPKGCSKCSYTGYRGRVLVYEILEVTEEIRDMISKDKDIEYIKSKAIDKGMVTMLEYGKNLVRSGTISTKELIKHVPMD